MNRASFNEKAKQQTLEHAVPKKTPLMQPSIMSPQSMDSEKPKANLAKRPISEKFNKLSKRKT